MPQAEDDSRMQDLAEMAGAASQWFSKLMRRDLTELMQGMAAEKKAKKKHRGEK
ncbi:hypothetical protein [Rhodobacter capsulatus]|uniref:hypothetical protein n=1 Tax=Rhodobacter capsulatus TaxID=1061 RepID=UPI0040264FB8